MVPFYNWCHTKFAAIDRICPQFDDWVSRTLYFLPCGPCPILYINFLQLQKCAGGTPTEESLLDVEETRTELDSKDAHNKIYLCCSLCYGGPASPLAHKRGEALQEEKAASDLGGLVELITKLVAKVDSLGRSLGMQQWGVPIMPPRLEAGLGQSVYCQALQQGSSLGMHCKQMLELGASSLGMGARMPVDLVLNIKREVYHSLLKDQRHLRCSIWPSNRLHSIKRTDRHRCISTRECRRPRTRRSTCATSTAVKSTRNLGAVSSSGRCSSSCRSRWRSRRVAPPGGNGKKLKSRLATTW
ncbi:hypothetical protein Plhal304r1_c019g0068921 [Plasmopara halstedii]